MAHTLSESCTKLWFKSLIVFSPISGPHSLKIQMHPSHAAFTKLQTPPLAKQCILWNLYKG